MKQFRTLTVLLLGLASGLAVAPALSDETLAPERIVWKKVPIAVHLEIGKERLVQFPARVKVGVPPPLLPRMSITPVDDTVYLLARQAFSDRLVVEETDTGRIYILDVTAGDTPVSGAPLVVHVERDPATAHSDQRNPEPHSAQEADTEPPGLVALVRYAAQQLYAPKRLRTHHPGLWSVPLRAQRPVPLIRGGKISALPLASWRSRDFYVTAVRLQNLSNQAVRFDVLDPRRHLRGSWEAASFQHSRLLPRGQAGDATALYLISVRPFEETAPAPEHGTEHEAGPLAKEGGEV